MDGTAGHVKDVFGAVESLLKLSGPKEILNVKVAALKSHGATVALEGKGKADGAAAGSVKVGYSEAIGKASTLSLQSQLNDKKVHAVAMTLKQPFGVQGATVSVEAEASPATATSSCFSWEWAQSAHTLSLKAVKPAGAFWHQVSVLPSASATAGGTTAGAEALFNGKTSRVQRCTVSLAQTVHDFLFAFRWKHDEETGDPPVFDAGCRLSLSPRAAACALFTPPTRDAPAKASVGGRYRPDETLTLSAKLDNDFGCAVLLTIVVSSLTASVLFENLFRPASTWRGGVQLSFDADCALLTPKKTCTVSLAQTVQDFLFAFRWKHDEETGDPSVFDAGCRLSLSPRAAACALFTPPTRDAPAKASVGGRYKPDETLTLSAKLDNDFGCAVLLTIVVSSLTASVLFENLFRPASTWRGGVQLSFDAGHNPKCLCTPHAFESVRTVFLAQTVQDFLFAFRWKHDEGGFDTRVARPLFERAVDRSNGGFEVSAHASKRARFERLLALLLWVDNGEPSRDMVQFVCEQMLHPSTVPKGALRVSEIRRRDMCSILLHVLPRCSGDLHQYIVAFFRRLVESSLASAAVLGTSPLWGLLQAPQHVLSRELVGLFSEVATVSFGDHQVQQLMAPLLYSPNCHVVLDYLLLAKKFLSRHEVDAVPPVQHFFATTGSPRSGFTVASTRPWPDRGFTFSASIYPHHLSGAPRLVSFGTGKKAVFEVHLTSRSVTVASSKDGTVHTADIPVALPCGSWSHVAVTFQYRKLLRSQVLVFVNGGEAGHAAIKYPEAPPLDDGAALHLFAAADGKHPFCGYFGAVTVLRDACPQEHLPELMSVDPSSTVAQPEGEARGSAGAAGGKKAREWLGRAAWCRLGGHWGPWGVLVVSTAADGKHPFCGYFGAVTVLRDACPQEHLPELMSVDPSSTVAQPEGEARGSAGAAGALLFLFMLKRFASLDLPDAPAPEHRPTSAKAGARAAPQQADGPAVARAAITTALAFLVSYDPLAVSGALVADTPLYSEARVWVDATRTADISRHELHSPAQGVHRAGGALLFLFLLKRFASLDLPDASAPEHSPSSAKAGARAAP
eukprot:gene7657-11738_t